VQESAPREGSKGDSRQLGVNIVAQASAIYLIYLSSAVSAAVGALYYLLGAPFPLILLFATITTSLGCILAYRVYRKKPSWHSLSLAQSASTVKTTILLQHAVGCLVIAAQYLQGLTSWLALFVAVILIMSTLLDLYRVYFSLAEISARENHTGLFQRETR